MATESQRRERRGGAVVRSLCPSISDDRTAVLYAAASGARNPSWSSTTYGHRAQQQESLFWDRLLDPVLVFCRRPKIVEVAMYSLLPMVAVLLLSSASTPEDRPRVYQGKTVSQWVEVLSTRDPELRCQAGKALAKLKPKDQQAISALVQRLEDKQGSVAISALDALSAIGTAAVPALIEALSNQDPDVR